MILIAIENSDAFTDLGPIVDEKNEVYVGSTDTGICLIFCTICLLLLAITFFHTDCSSV